MAFSNSMAASRYFSARRYCAPLWKYFCFRTLGSREQPRSRAPAREERVHNRIHACITKMPRLCGPVTSVFHCGLSDPATIMRNGTRRLDMLVVEFVSWEAHVKLYLCTRFLPTECLLRSYPVMTLQLF